MRNNAYYQSYRSRAERRRSLGPDRGSDDFALQQFGDVTSLVNALRNRAVYRFASLRLLADVVEATASFVPEAQRRAIEDRELPPPEEPGELLPGDYGLIERAAEAAPVLFRSLNFAPNPRFDEPRKETTIHRIVLGQESGVGAPLNALANLLAAEIARQFDEPAVAVIDDDGTLRATLWKGKRSRALTWRGSYLRFQRALRALLGKSVPLAHLVVAAPDGPGHLPSGFERPDGYEAKEWRWKHRSTAGYDRVVYLSRKAPAAAPADWLNLLNQTVFNVDADGRRSQPYFSSFVHTVTSEIRDAEFDTLSVDDEFQTPSAQRVLPESWRVERDHCRVPFDFEPIRKAWARAKAPGSGGAGAASREREAAVGALLDDKKVGALAGRWARAVTNRRVGVALGGGGASAFRLVPIVQGIRDNDVPIDLVGGVSGGALVGAYYSKWGRKGMEQCLRLGERIGLLSLAEAFVDGGFFKKLVDDDLGETQVTETQSRLVALTTAIVPKGPPQSHIVTRGTLGDAVQVSGAAAVMFAPVVRETVSHGELRFGDGSMSSYVPARILRDCGADVVFAFNCLSGPEQRNPLKGTPFAFVPSIPVIGRLIDLWVSGAYLVQRIGRETDEDAHVYFEPGDQEMPLVESFKFTESHRIARASGRSDRVRECIMHCTNFWHEFRVAGFVR